MKKHRAPFQDPEFGKTNGAAVDRAFSCGVQEIDTMSLIGAFTAASVNIEEESVQSCEFIKLMCRL